MKFQRILSTSLISLLALGLTGGIASANDAGFTASIPQAGQVNSNLRLTQAHDVGTYESLQLHKSNVEQFNRQVANHDISIIRYNRQNLLKKASRVQKDLSASTLDVGEDKQKSPQFRQDEVVLKSLNGQISASTRAIKVLQTMPVSGRSDQNEQSGSLTFAPRRVQLIADGDSLGSASAPIMLSNQMSCNVALISAELNNYLYRGDLKTTNLQICEDLQHAKNGKLVKVHLASVDLRKGLRPVNNRQGKLLALAGQTNLMMI